MNQRVDKPMTRAGCLTGCLIWLVVMSLPLAVIVLILNNELAWRRGPNNAEVDRIFLLNEPGYAGLGYEAARLNSPVDGDSVACVTVAVRYLLWRNDEGVQQNADFCKCFDTTGALAGTCEP
jgi:hypothetical protein